MCSYRDIIISARSSQQPLCGALLPPTCVDSAQMTQIRISMKVRIPKNDADCWKSPRDTWTWTFRDDRKFSPLQSGSSRNFSLGNTRNRNYREITISLRAPTNRRLKIPERHLHWESWRVTSANSYQYRIGERGNEKRARLRTQRVTPSERDSASSGWLYRKTLVPFRLVRFFSFFQSVCLLSQRTNKRNAPVIQTASDHADATTRWVSGRMC